MKPTSITQFQMNKTSNFPEKYGKNTTMKTKTNFPTATASPGTNMATILDSRLNSKKTPGT